VSISDPRDPGLPADFDAIALEGHVEGATFVATLTVAGIIQESGYDVMILVQDFGRVSGTYVYRLEFQFDKETSFGVQATRTDSRLTFVFPLGVLIHNPYNPYIVGLEAVTFASEGEDFVKEGPREALHISRVLALPIDTAVFAVAAAALAGTLLLVQPGVRQMLRPRRPR
jgi:hypothetical protein